MPPRGMKLPLRTKPHTTAIHHTPQHNTTQHFTTQHDTSQYNTHQTTIQHFTTQHNRSNATHTKPQHTDTTAPPHHTLHGTHCGLCCVWPAFRWPRSLDEVMSMVLAHAHTRDPQSSQPVRPKIRSDQQGCVCTQHSGRANQLEIPRASSGKQATLTAGAASQQAACSPASALRAVGALLSQKEGRYWPFISKKKDLFFAVPLGGGGEEGPLVESQPMV